MNRNEVLKLRQERAGLIAQARQLLDGKNEVSAEVRAQFDAIMADADRKKERIDIEERLSAEELALEGGRTAPQFAGNEERSERVTESKEYARAFESYLRYGMVDMPAEQRNLLGQGFNRAQSTSGSAGGYSIPQGFAGQVELAEKAFSNVEEVASVITTDKGNNIPWPTVNDTSNTGELIAENTGAASQDVTFGTATLAAYYFSSKIILVSWELLEDTGVNLEALIGEIAGQRLGRIKNTYMTTGTGSSQPHGIVTGSTLGVTAAAVAAITHSELIDLEHSVDPAYRKMEGTGFMFADSTLKLIKKLVDSEGRPLWLPGIAVREPDTVLGYKYVINQDMATAAAGTKSVLFGHFPSFKVRKVRDNQLFRVTDKYIESRQVGFIAYSRMDSRLLNAGTNPVKHLIQAAS
ncbi:MAG TPA: phage major capsid protein [Nitrospiraceae bacterium]|nr:phage major capsid protein [Nitrospiraceae bacterium]